mmetsp:Transcript_12020/g.29202  ORF Transcript_12020/g.29202 Transcript_12020/m.29202 type:complete len:392 (-) Transcript_12020:18-1193(-)
MGGTKKRKASTPKSLIVELVPKDSPWTEADWWNEKSQTCRPIVQSICTSLESGTTLLAKPPAMDKLTSSPSLSKEQASDTSPTGVADFPGDGEDTLKVLFDRGYVEYIPKTSGGGVFGLFHEGWGKLLMASEPWSIVGHNETVHSMHLKHTIRKTEGLFTRHASSCIATLQYESAEEEESTTTSDETKSAKQVAFPVALASRHLKVADFQFVLMKARNQVKSRRGGQVRSLKLELGNAESVDILPIIKVIVDDENGEIFVDDCVEVLDALIGFAGALATSEEYASEDRRNDDGDEEEEELNAKQQGVKNGNGWKIEHEKCGDLEQLTENWLASNKATAQSFVSLCIANLVPDSSATDRSAVHVRAPVASSGRSPISLKKRARQRRTIVKVT